MDSIDHSLARKNDFVTLLFVSLGLNIRAVKATSQNFKAYSESWISP